MTIRVSGPPHSRSSTSATSSPVAAPATRGTRSNSPRRVWRKGTSTSSECSRAWASGITRTCGSRMDAWAPSGSTRTSPRGVANHGSPGSASPRIGTKWAGPTRMTRLMMSALAAIAPFNVLLGVRNSKGPARPAMNRRATSQPKSRLKPALPHPLSFGLRAGFTRVFG